MDRSLIWPAVFLFPQFTALSDKELNNDLYYIHKASRTLQRIAIHDTEPVNISDLTSFPCEILTATVIWNCKLILIGKLCNFTGIVELPMGKFTIHNTSLSQSHRGVTTAVANNTLYVCGWANTDDDTACDYMTRSSMRFQPIPVYFSVSRRSFAMYAFDSRICVFGGFKNRTEDRRTQTTECAQMNDTETGLNFTQATPGLSCYRGHMSTLRIDGLLLFCGGFSGKGTTCVDTPLCEWMQFEDQVKPSYLSNLKDSFVFDKKFWELYDKVKIKDGTSELVLQGNRVTMLYPDKLGGTEVISVFINNGWITKIIGQRFSVLIEEIKPLSLQNKCIRDGLGNTLGSNADVAGDCNCPTVATKCDSNKVTSTVVDENMRHALEPSGEMTTTTYNDSRVVLKPVDHLTIGLVAMLTLAVLSILVLVGIIYKLYQSKPVPTHAHTFASVVSLKPEPELKSISCSPEQSATKLPQVRVPATSLTSIGAKISDAGATSDKQDSTVDIGPDSSTVHSLSSLFEAALDFSAKPSKRRTHAESSKLESVTTSIPSGSPKMMNKRAETTDSDSPVPLEDLPIQFLKRVLRKKRRDKSAKQKEIKPKTSNKS